MVLWLAANASQAQPINYGQYVHQSWTARDGSPSGICAIAQAPDGYLWLGTGTGLYRFDGVQFSRYQPEPGQQLASNDITALAFVTGGDLWMGSYYGGATLMKNGQLTAYSTRNGFPAGWVLNFAQGQDGAVWVATGQGLGRFDGTHWQRIGADWDYPADRADWVQFDPEGTLWVAAVNQLVYLRRGAKQFQTTDIALAPGAVLAVDNRGTLWVSDRLHGTRPLRGISAAHPNLPDIASLPVSDSGAATRFGFDQSGSLWASSLGMGGVFRVAKPDRIGSGANVTTDDVSSFFKAPLDLTSDNAVPVAEDREGDIWIGTSLGLDSFRPSRVGTLNDFHIDPHSHISISKDTSGAIWISNRGAVYRVDGDKLTGVVAGLTDILSIFVSSDDTLWIIGRHDLYRRHAGKLEKISLPNRLFASRMKFVMAGQDGSIWTSIEGLGLFKFGTAWQQSRLTSQYSKISPVSGGTDADGSMWLGYVGNELLHVFKEGKEHLYGSTDGINIGTVATISVGNRETLFGGDSGLARWRSGRIQSISSRRSAAFSGITGIVQLKNGDVWLNTGRGIVHISYDELSRAFGETNYHPVFKLYDFHDGVEGVALQGQPVSTLQQDREGKIWFATNQVLQWIDPSLRIQNPIAPPVDIKQVSSGGIAYLPSEAATLQKGSSAVQIDYTALSLSLPDRVRFRYRLDGVDKEWQDVGTRRQAYYTNLSPGRYGFHVIAANDDGIWNKIGASTTIIIPPLFYQAHWFRVLLSLVAAVVITMVFMMRDRRLTQNVRLQSEARHSERDIIARDLQDTLMQAVHALMLRFQALAAAIPKDDPLQEGIHNTIRVAEAFIAEGGNRVKTLRTAFLSTNELANAIFQLAENLQNASGIPIRTRVRTAYKELDPAISDNVFSICREGLLNAIQHTSAKKICIGMKIRKKSLYIEITGHISSMSLEESSSVLDRLDISGMQERANKIAAKLIAQSSATGTKIILEVPLYTPLHQP